MLRTVTTLFLLLTGLLLFGKAAAAEPMNLLVPMYFYPHMTDGATSDEDWLAVAAAGERIPTVAIVNIGNGLQDEISAGDIASYEAAMQLLDDAGVRMIGYVSSYYACHDAASIKAKIDRWHADWPLVTGIFVDETQNSLTAAEAFSECPDAVPAGFDYEAFYTDIGQHILSYDRFDFSVFNPGTDAPDALVDAAMVTVSFESRYENWATDITGDSQAGRAYAANRFSVMIYNTGELTPETITDIVTEAANRNYGYIHITDVEGWHSLPSYMETFIVALECHNGFIACDGIAEPVDEPSSGDSGGGSLTWVLLPLLLLRCAGSRFDRLLP